MRSRRRRTDVNEYFWVGIVVLLLLVYLTYALLKPQKF
jgi:K+-transporting ATPase KdpF subunit